MRNLYTVLFGLTLLFSTHSVKAQNLEIGPQIGGMMYTGDLDPGAFGENFKNLNLSFGAHFKYHFNQYLNLRVNFSKGQVNGRDSISGTEWRRQRNLSFESDITELALMVEANMLGFSVDDRQDKTFTPYAFAGIGIYKFNPRALLNGQYYDLQPLGTEGQGMPGFADPYALTQISVPIGGGLKFRVSQKISIGLEINGRFLFTDYIDDVSTTYVAYEDLLAGNGPISVALSNRESEYLGVDTPYTKDTSSQRGKADVNDYFSAGMVTFSYHFNTKGLFTSNRSQGCPTF